MVYVAAAVIPTILFCSVLQAETGHSAWLRYAPIDDPDAQHLYDSLPDTLVAFGDSPIIGAVRQELMNGVRGMLGHRLRVESVLPAESAIVIANALDLHRNIPELDLASHLAPESYVVKSVTLRGQEVLIVTGADDRGVLYGVFALLRTIAQYKQISRLDMQSTPYVSVRWSNQWDNLDGTIERGYSGRSIFFDNGNVLADLTRAGEFARLLASVGMNGCTVNNVNANPKALTPEFIPQLARIAAVFRPWGVRLSISIDFSSPKTVGGLDTFDPLDPSVAAWWKQKADEIYAAIPDFGGFVLKADSEGRVGPSTYRRTHAEAANVIARALKPHGGIVLYRGFVYDHHMDWRNPKNDRARAAYDNFKTLDGAFDDNALVQIKHGPIDFQVREPVSPLFGALRNTNETIEFQVTQEYTGQQRHLCYLVPMWKEVLDFDMHVGNGAGTVKGLVSGRTFHRPVGGFVAVTNVGLDANWLANDLAMVNLYGFGRLAWDPDLGAAEIAREWTRQTFGNDSRTVDTIVDLELDSWPAYENYTGPLGAGTLTDIIGIHYGPGIESSERNGWGQWHRADREGIGMDRTVATGTGYIGQYPADVAAIYESLKNCPDALLLFMHHVAYSHVLRSGKTVIQHTYDSHYEGAAEAQTFPLRWRRLRGLVDDDRFAAVLARLEYQAGHAIVWRDAVCEWFLKTSGISDEKGRVGHHPNRVEAESMTLRGYVPEAVTPWETASAGQAVACADPKGCSAEFRYAGEPGRFDIAVEYFDQRNGVSHFALWIGSQIVEEWAADDSLPTGMPDGHSATRRVIRGVPLRHGDEVRVVGRPDGAERAALDYVEIVH